MVEVVDLVVGMTSRVEGVDTENMKAKVLWVLVDCVGHIDSGCRTMSMGRTMSLTGKMVSLTGKMVSLAGKMVSLTGKTVSLTSRYRTYKRLDETSMPPKMRLHCG